MHRIAIVGAGIRGRMYESALRDAPDCQVVGFVEPSPEVAESARTMTGLPTFGDLNTLLDALSPTAAIIATPDFAHREPAVLAASAGLDLLVEKPLAMSTDDAVAILDAVEEAGVHCLVGFENRWNPHFIQVSSAIAAGEIGAVLTQRATLSNTYHVPERMLSWAARSSPAWFLLPHTADLAVWLSGRSPVAVVGVGTRGVLAARGIDTWDSVDAMIRFDDGSVATLGSSWVEPQSTPAIVEFTYALTGVHGSARMDLGDQGLALATAGSFSRPWPVGGRVGGNLVGPSIWMARDWAGMLSGTVPWGPDARHGLLITRLVAAVEESMTTQSWVALPPV